MQSKRATIYLDAEIHKALKFKSISTEQSISSLVNEVLKQALAEDAEDIATIKSRKNERTTPFEAVIKELKDDGYL